MSGLYNTVVESSTEKVDKDFWRTPSLFINDIKHLLNVSKFSVDACCANESIAIADSLSCITESQDSLSVSNWLEFSDGKFDSRNPLFCNPPFSKKYVFFKKAVEQVKLTGVPCVFILPYEPVSKSWVENINDVNCLVYIPDSRYHYLKPDGKKTKNGCNFPSCFVYIVPFNTNGAITINYKKGVSEPCLKKVKKS